MDSLAGAINQGKMETMRQTHHDPDTGEALMKCPVCKNSKSHLQLDIHSNGFDEEIYECDICGASWSVNHGTIEVIKDSQPRSFLESISENVEGDDYNQPPS